MGTRIRLKRLCTWDHRRAIDPMIAAAMAFAEQRPDVEIAWDVQPLSGFEFRPIDDIVRAYDLLVFDHPHVGHAAEAGLCVPSITVAARHVHRTVPRDLPLAGGAVGGADRRRMPDRCATGPI